MRRAVLVLEDGATFTGAAFGADGETFGEVVFNTAITGYQEVLTDPSYRGQIVAMTAPEIGNTGVNAADEESARPFCAGFACRELSPLVSSWRAERDLDRYLQDHGVIGITDVDTRALTRILRTKGALRGAISTTESDPRALIERVKQSPTLEGRDLVREVTTPQRYTFGDGAVHVVAYDFGIKRNILRSLAELGCRVTVLPAETPASEALAERADGYFLSNGPGDPEAVTYAADAARALVASGKPVFGICLGHQILGLALGGKTYKLGFGHHGANHPVKDLATGKVAITSQNHGFAVDVASLAGKATLTHVNLNDGTVEGMRLEGKPVFSVQYHPEASPGPHDAAYLFGRFLELMRR